MNQYRAENFFDLSDSPAAGLFRDLEYVWMGVAALPRFIEEIIRPGVLGEVEEGAWLDPGKVQVGEGSRIERGAIIRGPTIIGGNTVVRSNAYIRGHVMVGDGCLVGCGAELRQVLVLDDTNLPHVNLIFTSLIGNHVRIGGGTYSANLRQDGAEIKVRVPVDGVPTSFPTGLTYFGFIIGDGCNVAGQCLTMPGTIISRNCVVYPQCSISGFLPEGSLMKRRSVVEEIVPRKDFQAARK